MNLSLWISDWTNAPVIASVRLVKIAKALLSFSFTHELLIDKLFFMTFNQLLYVNKFIITFLKSTFSEFYSSKAVFQADDLRVPWFI